MKYGMESAQTPAQIPCLSVLSASTLFHAMYVPLSVWGTSISLSSTVFYDVSPYYSLYYSLYFRFSLIAKLTCCIEKQRGLLINFLYKKLMSIDGLLRNE